MRGLLSPSLFSLYFLYVNPSFSTDFEGVRGDEKSGGGEGEGEGGGPDCGFMIISIHKSFVVFAHNRGEKQVCGRGIFFSFFFFFFGSF